MQYPLDQSAERIRQYTDGAITLRECINGLLLDIAEALPALEEDILSEDPTVQLIRGWIRKAKEE